MMEQWTDEILAEKAQAGNTDAARVLTERYYKVCQFEAMDSKQKLYDVDTRTGECMLALVKAIKHYREGNGTTFNSYAKTLMRNAMMDMARKEKRRPSEVSIHDQVDGSELSMEDAFASTSDVDQEAQAELAKQTLKASIQKQLFEASAGGSMDKLVMRALKGFATELATAGRIKASPQAVNRLFSANVASVLFLVAGEDMIMPEEESAWREEFFDILTDSLINLVILKSEGNTVAELSEITGFSEVLIGRLMLSVRCFALENVINIHSSGTKATKSGCVVLPLKIKLNPLQDGLFDAA